MRSFSFSDSFLVSELLPPPPAPPPVAAVAPAVASAPDADAANDCGDAGGVRLRLEARGDGSGGGGSSCCSPSSCPLGTARRDVGVRVDVVAVVGDALPAPSPPL